MKVLSTLLVLPLLLAFAGCDKNKDDGGKREDKPRVAAPAKTPDVTGKWVGRWESGKHKGHGGGLNCVVTETGRFEYAANFTAEFGKVKDYPIKLTGKPEDGKVVFGGNVDLGKEDGGVFKWTGRATKDEFSGEYEGGGDTGTFKMARAKN